MLIDVCMPQMGESLAEGTVVRWMKQAGDPVERDEPLFEISTDKVDTDVPSPAAGTLRTILVAAGQTVAVGAPVAVIEDGLASAAVESRAAVPATTGGMPERSEQPAGHFKSTQAAQLVSFRRGTSQEAAPLPAPASPAPVERRSFSPAVLESARRGGVTLQALTALSGSGRGGRVTKADVARFIESGVAPRGARRESSSRGNVPPEYLYHPTPDDQVMPMSPVRRKIADHMSWSVRISPHASAFAECDMTAAVDLMRRERDAFVARVGVPLTVTALAAVALARTIREFPALNASVVDDTIVVKPRVHLGIAVALADSDDLIVPVVRDADGLSLAGMARAVADLASRARARRLRPEDVQGGTVTLTNPGMFGGVTGTPILNQPQVAMLGLGAIVKRAVVLEGDRIAPRPMMTLALTFDHRAADGMAAFRFLGRLKARLEAAPPEETAGG
jgi:pyruvate/2-oxoglutarate dehydrogenase complex dihydrolipoamide acyltransferase (E2) component